MAESIHLYLKANGFEIKGESTQISLGRQDSIECVCFDQLVQTIGKRQYQPLLIRKRIDKSSPLLFKALCENAVIEASFLFYRPNPTGDGTTEQFYTVEIKKGRIASIRNYLPDTLSSATEKFPALEEVTFVFQTISWTYTDGGVVYEDNISGRTKM